MSRRSRLYNVDAEELQDLYLSNSAKEIGREFGVGESTVRRQLKKFGIRKGVAREFTPEEEELMMQEREDSAKAKMISAFDEWAKKNMVGYSKSGKEIFEAIESGDINYEGDDTWQINSQATDRITQESWPEQYRILKGDIRLVYDEKDRKMEIFMKEWQRKSRPYTQIV
jgi:hypothetical protein